MDGVSSSVGENKRNHRGLCSAFFIDLFAASHSSFISLALHHSVALGVFSLLPVMQRCHLLHATATEMANRTA
jgi:hypothetical protein